MQGLIGPSIMTQNHHPLLQRAEKVGLLPAGVGQAAAKAYREMRRLQHRARLNEEPTQVDPDTLAAERNAILALWQGVMAFGG